MKWRAVGLTFALRFEGSGVWPVVETFDGRGIHEVEFDEPDSPFAHQRFVGLAEIVLRSRMGGVQGIKQICLLVPDIANGNGFTFGVVNQPVLVGGYVVKTHAGSELLAAVGAVLGGRQYISSGLSGHPFTDATDPQASRFRTPAGSPIAGTEKKEIACNHEVEFYSDDASFLAGLTRFVENALEAGSKVIVVATESHRNGLLQGLQARGVDTAAAAQQEHFLLLDAAEALSKFMENEGPSRERFLSTVAPLIRCAEIKHKRVELFGEMVALLCADGRMKAAIELERLGNELAQTHPVFIRCAYPMTEELKGEPYAAICAEHSAVLSAET